MFGGAALCSQCWRLVGIWIPHSATLRMISMAFPGHPIQNASTPSCILFWIPVRVLMTIYNNQLINIFSLFQFVSLIRMWESQGASMCPCHSLWRPGVLHMWHGSQSKWTNQCCTDCLGGSEQRRQEKQQFPVEGAGAKTEVQIQISLILASVALGGNIDLSRLECPRDVVSRSQSNHYIQSMISFKPVVHRFASV